MENTIVKKPRMVSQDIAKGLAILIVVANHTVQLSKGIGSVIAILFGTAMPFFFLIAGYNYRNKGLSPWQNIAKRTWQILKPMLLFSVSILVLMGAYFLIRGEATIAELLKSYAAFLISKWGANMLGWNLKQVLFQRLLGPCWFLQFMVIAGLFFYPTVDWAISNSKRLISILVLLSGLSMLMLSFNLQLPWGVQAAPAIACLMILGAYYNKTDFLFAQPSKKIWTWINCIVCLAVIALIQLNFNGAGMLGAGALGETDAGVFEVFILYIMGTCGTYFLINFCKLIEKTKYVSKFFVWLGRNTLVILMVHVSIMHVVKDILGLEQHNAADQLFRAKGEPMDGMEFVALAITMILVCAFVKVREQVLSKATAKAN